MSCCRWRCLSWCVALTLMDLSRNFSEARPWNKERLFCLKPISSLLQWKQHTPGFKLQHLQWGGTLRTFAWMHDHSHHALDPPVLLWRYNLCAMRMKQNSLDFQHIFTVGCFMRLCVLPMGSARATDSWNLPHPNEGCLFCGLPSFFDRPFNWATDFIVAEPTNSVNFQSKQANLQCCSDYGKSAN